MIVGAPKEIKRDEYRVSLLPVGVEELTRAGHRVLVETGAGLGSGITDQEYAKSGAEMVDTVKELFQRSDMIIKVKEPQPSEVAMVRRGQIMFTYFHLAADKSLTESLAASGVIAVAYETLSDDHGRLPLLTPMSEVAGRMSIQEGAKYLERPQMGAAFSWPACRGSSPPTSPSSAAAWSGPTPRGSRPASAPTFRCWTSTWIGCVTSTKSCRRM